MRKLTAILVLALAPSMLAATRGMVFSAAGQPVVGAEVVAYRPEAAGEQQARLVAGGGRVALAKGVTGDDGAFALEAKLHGVLELIVTRDGFAPARELGLADGELALELQPVKTRSGRVTSGGKPVADATVVAFIGDHAVWQTKTDARGAYSMPDPKRWASAVAILHPGFAIHESRSSLDAVLTAGDRVTGTVLDAKGAPAAGARIFHGDWLLGTAGADGKFALGHVAPDVTMLLATGGGAGGRAVRGKGELAITLGPPRSISGSVRDVNKRPLAGAIVTGSQRASEQTISAVTDDKGNYRLEGVGAGQVWVVPLAAGDLAFQPATVSLLGASTARADFTAAAAKSVRGTVVDERKRPVAGAAVQLSVMQMPTLYAHGAANWRPARTGSDGRFAIPLDVESELAGQQGLEFRVQALKPGLAVAVSEAFDPTGETKPLTLVLRDGVELSGIVVDAAGKPVAGAGIVALEEPYGAVPLPLETVMTTGVGSAFVETDAEGRFSFRVNQRPHDLGVWKETYAGARVASIVPGGKPLKIVLEQGAELRGRVVRKGGGALPEMSMITARGDDGGPSTTMVESDGTFSFAGLRAGEYALRLEDLTGSAPEKRVKAPATDVVFELEAQTAVHGRVLDKATGEPVAVAYNVAADARGGVLASRDVAAGEPFTLGVSPGAVTVSVQAPGYARQTVETIVTADQPSQVTVELSRARTLAGRVVDDAGAPVAGANVSLDVGLDDPWFAAPAQSAADGAFVLEDVPREAVKLAIQSNRHLAASIDVPAGDDQHQLQAVVRRGESVKGRVVSSEGVPVEKAAVSVDSDDDYRSATTNADGTFLVEGLSKGRHGFTASRNDLGESERVESDIPAASEVVLTMKPSAGSGSVHGKVAGFTDGKWQYGIVTAGNRTRTSGMINRDGTYRIEQLPAGEVELRAAGMNADGTSGSTPKITATVIAGGDVEANLAFRNDVVVRGTVTENGQPVARAEVRFFGDNSMWRSSTNERGQYEIAGVEPGMYSVSVASGRQVSFDTRYNVTGSGTFDIAVDTIQLSGRVVDTAGKPIAKADVAAANASTREQEETIETDANGAFALRVPRGDYVLTAAASGFIASTQRVAGGDAPVVIALSRGEGLAVRLTDARTGRRLSGYVVAMADDGTLYTPVGEKDGAHQLPLPPGAYRVAASANGFASLSTRVSVPAAKEAALALTPGGKLTIRSERNAAELVKLVLPNGEEYVQCHCNGIAEIRLRGAVTEVPNVAPGAYTLRVLDHDGRVIASYPVTIAEGRTTTAEIHVPE